MRIPAPQHGGPLPAASGVSPSSGRGDTEQQGFQTPPRASRDPGGAPSIGRSLTAPGSLHSGLWSGRSLWPPPEQPALSSPPSSNLSAAHGPWGGGEPPQPRALPCGHVPLAPLGLLPHGTQSSFLPCRRAAPRSGGIEGACFRHPPHCRSLQCPQGEAPCPGVLRWTHRRRPQIAFFSHSPGTRVSKQQVCVPFPSGAAEELQVSTRLPV